MALADDVRKSRRFMFGLPSDDDAGSLPIESDAPAPQPWRPAKTSRMRSRFFASSQGLNCDCVVMPPFHVRMRLARQTCAPDLPACHLSRYRFEIQFYSLPPWIHMLVQRSVQVGDRRGAQRVRRLPNNPAIRTTARVSASPRRPTAMRTRPAKADHCPVSSPER